MLTLIWGCNWPILKMGVTEIAPLTFRAITLPFAALGMLAVARFSGDSIRIPRALWGKVRGARVLQHRRLERPRAVRRPAAAGGTQRDHRLHDADLGACSSRSSLLREPLGRRRIVGLALGMLGMALLLGDDIRHLQRAPTAALLILGAAIVVGARHRAAAQVEAADRRRTRCPAG